MASNSDIVTLRLSLPPRVLGLLPSCVEAVLDVPLEPCLQYQASMYTPHHGDATHYTGEAPSLCTDRPDEIILSVFDSGFAVDAWVNQDDTDTVTIRIVQEDDTVCATVRCD